MRAKRNRFDDNKSASNVIQEGKPLFDTIKGKWNSEYFINTNPITLELACGYGEYTTGLAKVYPNRNFIGVDIKGDRFWQGSNLAIGNNLNNVAFLRILVHDLADFFDENEVSDIWLVYPDPRPKNKDERRRLTNKRFLNLYKGVLKPGGWVRLKTDDVRLFAYTIEELNKRSDIIGLEYTNDLSISPLLEEQYGITTRYEKMFLERGSSINYLKFKFAH